MADQARKTDTIRRIEGLKLSTHLIQALEDAATAETVTEAVFCLEQWTEQWY
jgi:hypothetical protein